jgi:F0F1-type ATP synthase membrane subunit c/vacuolar-type H+-ATPase subunit K
MAFMVLFLALIEVIAIYGLIIAFKIIGSKLYFLSKLQNG